MQKESAVKKKSAPNTRPPPPLPRLPPGEEESLFLETEPKSKLASPPSSTSIPTRSATKPASVPMPAKRSKLAHPTRDPGENPYLSDEEVERESTRRSHAVLSRATASSSTTVPVRSKAALSRKSSSVLDDDNAVVAVQPRVSSRRSPPQSNQQPSRLRSDDVSQQQAFYPNAASANVPSLFQQQQQVPMQQYQMPGNQLPRQPLQLMNAYPTAPSLRSPPSAASSPYAQQANLVRPSSNANARGGWALGNDPTFYQQPQQQSMTPSSYYAQQQQGYYAQQLVQQQAPQPPPVRQPSRYQVLYGEELGSGGYGTVYKAFDTFTGEYVAVKETQVGRASQDALRQALRSEFEVLTRLDHPHIVKVLSFSCDDGKSQIFMEWLPSGSVSHILCGTGFRFHERVIRRYTSEALRGLAYLHSQGLLHRDIKPGNMLVTGSAVVKLSDFGTSKHVTQASAPSTAQIVGTPSYMSKEAIALGKYSKGSDVWAMACSVVEMASGRPPWSELPAEQQAPIPLMFRIGSASPPDHHPAIPPHLSAELQTLLRRMFAADPEQRPSAEALLADPYFTSSDLPQSAESADAFQDALREAFKSRQQSVSSMTVSSAWLLTGSSSDGPLPAKQSSDEVASSRAESATW